MLETLKKLIEDKKVLVLGFGREGRSTLASVLRAGGYAAVAVSDKNPVDAGGVSVICGSHYLDVLNDYDVVFKSPGIVLPQPIESYSCEIVSETEVFFRHFKDQIIGITGTKGKSTTTTLLHHVLKASGAKTALAGNIGIPVFDIAGDIEPDTKIVVELSCHQLEYMTVSPKIGVLMNIHEEHLDHYGTMEKYVAAKENIYRNQVQGDVLVCNELNLPKEGTCKASVISVGNEPTDADIKIGDDYVAYKDNHFELPIGEMKLIGHHNYFDIGIVYAVCKELGMDDETFKNGLCSYDPLPHRLQYIGTVNDVKYYDDSISTICETTIQALESLKNVGSVLVGGMDRGIDYHDLEKYLCTSNVDYIILMAATGKRIYEEITANFPDFKGPERLVLVDTLWAAVEKAKELTKPGKCCVLSPAAASYGIFKNFEERGEVFTKYVLEGKR